MSSTTASSSTTAPPVASAAGPYNLLRPLWILWMSFLHVPGTILTVCISRDLKPLFNFSLFKDAWFARFWRFMGPRSREMSAPVVVPLISNNATGVCLDIGPGAGEWLYLFAKAKNPSITKIYGVEPNIGMHPKLRENAVKAGLGDIYEIVGCGAQELQAKAGFQSGSIDTIITIQCLCSIPTPQVVIRELAPLLKPGGKWLVFEHVKTKYRGFFVDRWQAGLNLIWPQFLNGCDIRRPTDQWLVDAAQWRSVDLRDGKGEGYYDTIPHVVGTLTKET